MSTVSLNNPFINIANKGGEAKMKQFSEALSTGKDSAVGVVNLSLASSLRTKGELLRAVNKTNAYASTALTVAHESLKKISNGLKGALIDAKSVVNSMPKEDKEKLAVAIKLKVDNIKNQINTSEFNGTKLLTGGLGGDSRLTKLTEGIALGSRINAAFSPFSNTSVLNVDSIQANGVNAGDTVTIKGVTFTFVNAADVNSENQIALGANDAVTAQNLSMAIGTSQNPALNGVEATIDPGNAANVLLTNISGKSSLGIVSTGVARIVIANPTVGTHGINLSGLKNVTVDDIRKATFLSAEHVSGAAAQNLAASVGIAHGANHAGNVAAKLNVKIGDQSFTGVAYHDNGLNLNNVEVKFKNDSTNETFSIVMDGTANLTLPNQVTATGMKNRMQAYLRSLDFNETTKLEIDTSKGTIKDADGTNIASLKGMSARITSNSSIEGKTFNDFKIEKTDAGIKFTAKIIDEKGTEATFTQDIAQANIATLVAGKKLSLTHAASGDSLNINIGEFGLASLADTKNIDKISDAIKDAFVKPGMRVRTNTSFNDTIDVKIKNLSSDSLFKDKAGIEVKNFDLGDDAGVQKAEEVLENTLAIIENEIASVAAQIENLQSIADEINSLAASSEDAAGNYDNTDIAKKSQEFNKLLTDLRVRLSVMGAGNRSVDEVVNYLRDTIRQ